MLCFFTLWRRSFSVRVVKVASVNLHANQRQLSASCL